MTGALPLYPDPAALLGQMERSAPGMWLAYAVGCPIDPAHPTVALVTRLHGEGRAALGKQRRDGIEVSVVRLLPPAGLPAPARETGAALTAREASVLAVLREAQGCRCPTAGEIADRIEHEMLSRHQARHAVNSLIAKGKVAIEGRSRLDPGKVVGCE